MSGVGHCELSRGSLAIFFSLFGYSVTSIPLFASPSILFCTAFPSSSNNEFSPLSFTEGWSGSSVGDGRLRDVRLALKLLADIFLGRERGSLCDNEPLLLE